MRQSILLMLLLLRPCSLAGDGFPGAVVQMLVPGFKVEELPVRLSNQNNLRFAPDGSLTSLGYDGRIWRMRDTDGDGLEDSAEPIWDQPSLSVPLGMAWSTQGLLVSSKGKVSLFKDVNGDGVLDLEEVVVSGWPPTDVGSGGVDATAVTQDAQGNIYFGLLVADYSNAYRLRKRKELSPAQIEWLKAHSRWKEASGPGSGNDEFSLYDIESPRGTIQRWDPKARRLSTVATGLRVPVALAFNRAGDLFNTDQEGETWMPNGNPLDELNHIVAGRNYGFPPGHPDWLPRLVSEAPVMSFGPQHQSACGLVFNEPHPASDALRAGGGSTVPVPAGPAQGRFGPKAWEGDAFIAGESRGRIWRTHLARTPSGYAAQSQTIARVAMLVLDVAISPSGALYFCCHSGPPDWGSGPKGYGRIFKISMPDERAPVPLLASPTSLTEVRVFFSEPVHPDAALSANFTNAQIEFGDYVTAGDRFEVLKPPYAAVQQQGVTPRGRLHVRGARIENGGRELVLQTDIHPLQTHYSVALPGIRAPGTPHPGFTAWVDYDFSVASQPLPMDLSRLDPGSLKMILPWAPKGRPSHGTTGTPSKPDGDWEHGREMFFGSQMQCSKCHRIRGDGGMTGPDLSNLVSRDSGTVLRDIMEPGATLHPDYVTYQAVLTDGEVVSGFVRNQTAGFLHMFDAEGRETVIPRNRLSGLRASDLSLMPSGLLSNTSTNDVRDLLTFLLWAPPRRSGEQVAQLLSGPPKSASASDRPGTQPGEGGIVLVASKQDHGPGQHDYPAWQTNWSQWLNPPGAPSIAVSAWEWPSAAQFKAARLIVFYFWNHSWSQERLDELGAFLKRGGGAVFIHSAVISDDQPEALAGLIGLAAHPRRTGYRHMPFELELSTEDHQITRGLPSRIELLDEPYWPLIGAGDGVHVLFSGRVDGQSRPLVWALEHGAGRVFVSVPGHYAHTLEDPLFKTVLLRGMSWAARVDLGRFEISTSSQ